MEIGISEYFQYMSQFVETCYGQDKKLVKNLKECSDKIRKPLNITEKLIKEECMDNILDKEGVFNEESEAADILMEG